MTVQDHSHHNVQEYTCPCGNTKALVCEDHWALLTLRGRCEHRMGIEAWHTGDVRPPLRRWYGPHRSRP